VYEKYQENLIAIQNAEEKSPGNPFIKYISMPHESLFDVIYVFTSLGIVAVVVIVNYILFNRLIFWHKNTDS
jgi:putative flippase GtrA